MKPLLNWWKAAWANNIKRTLNNNLFELKGVSRNLPYLTFRWFIENHSETNIEIRRIFGSLYMEDRLLIAFDTYNPIIKQLGVNRQQYLTIKSKTIKKDDRAEVELNFNPPIEFWILDKSNSFSFDGGIEVTGHSTIVSIPIFEDNLKNSGIAEATMRYKEVIKNNLKFISSEI